MTYSITLIAIVFLAATVIGQAVPGATPAPAPVPSDPTAGVVLGIQSAAERLTVLGILAGMVVAFWRGWFVSGDSVEKRITVIRSEAEKRLEDYRKDYERQIQDLRNELDRTRHLYDLEIQRIRAQYDIEVKRLQDGEIEWQRIALGSLGISERTSRIVERGVITGMVSRLDRGGDTTAVLPDPSVNVG